MVDCAVVVDSRNVYSQGLRRFGSPRHVSVQGIRSSLTDFGLNVKDVHIGVATETLTNAQPSQRLSETSEANRHRAEEWKLQGAQIMHGVLAERGRDLEEKQVDVLCALRIAELAVRRDPEVIVVLSEDMDLTPACALAVKWGATPITVAPARVNERRGDHEWALLDNRQLATALSFPEPTQTASLRRTLANMVTAHDRSYKFRYRYADRATGQHVFQSNAGLPATASMPGALVPGQKYDLYPVGLRVNAQSSSGIPTLELAWDPTDSIANVNSASVTYWTRQDRLKVDCTCGASHGLAISCGESLLPQDDVLVLHQGDSSVYVGPLQANGGPSAKATTQTSYVAEVTRVTSDNLELRLYGAAEQSGIIPGGWRDQLPRAAVGQALRVTVAGQHQSGTLLCLPLTSGFLRLS